MRAPMRAALVALALATALTGVATEAAPSPAAGIVAGHYDLVRSDGTRVTERSFPGRWQLVFFGFTNCPDICPTTLLSVRHALDELGPLGTNIEPVFITLDPARDTPEKLRDYLHGFGPTFVGLTGTEADVREAARAFRVYLEVRALSEDSYTVDHSAFLYLLDPDGHFVQLLSGDAPGHQLADTLREALH